MQVVIEKDMCQGHGRCYTEAPDMFAPDEIGYIAQDGTHDVPQGLEPLARTGASVCPEAAIRVVE